VWLAERLLEQLAGGSAPRLSADAARFLTEHDWPGNVRELKTAMSHALALSGGSAQIERAHLPRPLISGARRPTKAEPSTKSAIVREAIDATLRACAGNVSEAARRLGVGRGTIYRAVKGSKDS
jgi:transcriptional regulator of acetoin/glycerol metabolism